MCVCVCVLCVCVRRSLMIDYVHSCSNVAIRYSVEMSLPSQLLRRSRRRAGFIRGVLSYYFLLCFIVFPRSTRPPCLWSSCAHVYVVPSIIDQHY